MARERARLTPMGGAGARLYIFPGLGGSADELAGAARLLATHCEIIGVEPPTEPDPTVEAMAAAAWSEIRNQSPHGPYRLLGYSFGGLVAIETARLIKAAGERVERLIITDTIFDRRYWPATTFVTAQLARTLHNVRGLAGLPAREALATALARARRLKQRIGERVSREPAVNPTGPGADPIAVCGRAAARYRPRFYAGTLTLISASPGIDFGCDVAKLWRPFAARLSTISVTASHLGIVRDAASVPAFAAAVADCLAAAEPARILLVTRQMWLTTARVALGFADAGCMVEALCPRAHPLMRLPFVKRRHRFGLGAPGPAIAAAILRAAPDLIVPADDTAALALREALCDQATPDECRALLQASLGGKERAGGLISRSDLLDAADRLHLSCPTHAAIASIAELDSWLDRFGVDAVIKTDGSWGGMGVAIVTDRASAHAAFRRMDRPPAALRAFKRLIADRDRPLFEQWLRRRRPALSIQKFITGHDATLAASAHNGELLASVAVEVVEQSYRNGPSTVVRIIEDKAMTLAARRLAGELRLSGLFGLDFAIDSDGKAWLVELNARATPTCHLAAAPGASPVGALAARLGATPPPQPAAPDGPIALFPQELMRAGEVRYEHHDIPWHSPEFVAMGLALANAAHRSSGGDIAAGTGPAVERP